MEAEGRRPWFHLPDAQLAGRSAARAISCPAQPTELYFIKLVLSPPQLIQLQYCRNNFWLLPEEEQTSEAGGALPSAPAHSGLRSLTLPGLQSL